MILAYLCMGWCAFILVMNFASMWLMGRKCRARARNMPAPAEAPPVTIIRPLCGLETFSEETLGATFDLDYPNYEIIFCVQFPNDPIIPLVEQLIAAHPEQDARLLIGDDYVSQNPKLNNCVKGWNAARNDYVILADSNALPPRDYIQTMLAAFEPNTAMTVSMPIGTRPTTFWSMVECAILNTFQARWQYGAEAIGAAFAQGKNMMWRREVLERAGGIRALACEIAEDAASTKVIRAQNMSIRLVDMPFEQPLGDRTAQEVYSRHVRWARLRRVTFPAHYAPEFMNGSFVAVVLGSFAAFQIGGDIIIAATTAALIVGAMHGAELWLARVCGFPVDWRKHLALFVRDLLLPVIFVDALIFDDFVWHGNAMSVREVEDAAG